MPLTSDYQNLLPEVLKWNGGISCDSNRRTFRSIYVSFDHIDVSCFHLASVFGIAYLNIALFNMALRQFCLHVLHMWKDNDQVDARLRQ
jgi:hypothetical protein